jgi:hypothetical protein
MCSFNQPDWKGPISPGIVVPWNVRCQDSVKTPVALRNRALRKNGRLASQGNSEGTRSAQFSRAPDRILNKSTIDPFQALQCPEGVGHFPSLLERRSGIARTRIDRILSCIQANFKQRAVYFKNGCSVKVSPCGLYHFRTPEIVKPPQIFRGVFVKFRGLGPRAAL